MALPPRPLGSRASPKSSLRAWRSLPFLALVLMVSAAIPADVGTARQRTVRDGAEPPVRILRGQVKSDDDSATLLRRARVTVIGNTGQPVFTDHEGRFEIAVP